jgi:transcriptional regulator with XRE-family HTH domain
MPLNAVRLRKLRSRWGYSQEKLAKQLGMGIRQIHRYESEIGQPTAEALAKISIELGTSMEYLMGIVDEPDVTGQSLSPTEAHLLYEFRQGDLAALIQIIAAQPFARLKPLNDVEP